MVRRSGFGPGAFFVAARPRRWQNPPMYESRHLSRPTRRQMAVLAVKILGGLAKEAEPAPIPMTDAAWIALAVLMHDGIAVDHQAGRYVDAVTKPALGEIGAQADYMRSTEMSQMVGAWQREITRRDIAEEDRAG